jgi:hypothetical protein
MTESFGEWADDDASPSDPGESEPAASPPSTILAAMAFVDLQVAVQDAVRTNLLKRVDVEAIAAVAVDAVLDEPTLAQMNEAVAGAAQLALAAPPTPEPHDEPPELYYPDVVTFVTEQLVPMYRRPLGGPSVTWCPQWWRHAEAIARLEALWRAWEHLRLDPATGMSVWFRDHADHHMAVLLSSDGPFKGCKPKEGHGDRLESFPLEPPPAGLFDTT